MFKKKRKINRPTAGALYCPKEQHTPELKNSWYLTVNERYPPKDSLSTEQVLTICKRMLSGSIQNRSSELRSWIYVYNESGYVAGLGILKDKTIGHIVSKIQSGHYSGTLHRSDYKTNRSSEGALVMKTATGTRTFNGDRNALDRYARSDSGAVFYHEIYCYDQPDDDSDHYYGVTYEGSPDYLSTDISGDTLEDGVRQRTFNGIDGSTIIRRTTSDPRAVKNLNIQGVCSNNKRPRCRLVGEDGNIFNLISIAYKALSRAGMKDKAEEMQNRIFTEAEDYDHALRIIMQYVEAY